MNTTTNDTDTIRCGYCGHVETKAQARECSRLDALTPNDEPNEPRWLGEGHPHDTW